MRRVLRHPLFDQTVRDRAAGMLGLESQLQRLEARLAEDPFSGATRLRAGVPRYAVSVNAGTLQSRIVVDYFVTDDTVELLQVIPVENSEGRF